MFFNGLPCPIVFLVHPSPLLIGLLSCSVGELLKKQKTTNDSDFWLKFRVLFCSAILLLVGVGRKTQVDIFITL